MKLIAAQLAVALAAASATRAIPLPRDADDVPYAKRSDQISLSTRGFLTEFDETTKAVKDSILQQPQSQKIDNLPDLFNSLSPTELNRGMAGLPPKDRTAVNKVKKLTELTITPSHVEKVNAELRRESSIKIKGVDYPLQGSPSKKLDENRFRKMVTLDEIAKGKAVLRG